MNNQTTQTGANETTNSAGKGTAVVTGASAGLGKIYADRLAKRGYDLILIARRGDKLNSVAESLRSNYGVVVHTLVADLGLSGDVDNVVSAITRDNSITLLVNNAGTSTLAPVAATTPAQLESMNSVNVTALTRLSHAILPVFKARNQGTLINIGSILGIHTLPISSIYSGTKGYVQNFTRGLQDEVIGTNVIVQLVMPSSTATDIWELSGVPLSQLNQASIMSAEDCVDAALAGLDQGELVTLPSVEDTRLFAAYDATRIALFQASQNGRPASRYTSGK